MEAHHTAQGPAWAAAVEQSGLGGLLRDSVWLYPAVETLHIIGFALAVPMGLLLFTTEATAYVGNPAFLAKMALLALALANIAWFHARLTRARDGQGTAGVLRASALLSLGLWVGVLVAGRIIAYV